MNDVERMRIELDAAMKRIRKLEILFETKAIFNDDEREAQRLAEQFGFGVEILLLPLKQRGSPIVVNGLREKLCRIARELRASRKWPASRIARTLHLCERTVERMLS